MEEYVKIVPANPGYRIIFVQERRLYIGDDVIAWKITVIGDNDHSEPIAAMSMGDLGKNFFGVLCPNGSVSAVDAQYDSFDLAQKSLLE